MLHGAHAVRSKLSLGRSSHDVSVAFSGARTDKPPLTRPRCISRFGNLSSISDWQALSGLSWLSYSRPGFSSSQRKTSDQVPERITAPGFMPRDMKAPHASSGCTSQVPHRTRHPCPLGGFGSERTQRSLPHHLRHPRPETCYLHAPGVSRSPCSATYGVESWDWSSWSCLVVASFLRLRSLLSGLRRGTCDTRRK